MILMLGQEFLTQFLGPLMVFRVSRNFNWKEILSLLSFNLNLKLHLLFHHKIRQEATVGDIRVLVTLSPVRIRYCPRSVLADSLNIFCAYRYITVLNQSAILLFNAFIQKHLLKHSFFISQQVHVNIIRFFYKSVYFILCTLRHFSLLLGQSVLQGSG